MSASPTPEKRTKRVRSDADLEQWQRVKQMKEAGYSYREIASFLGLSKQRVQRIAYAAGVPRQHHTTKARARVNTTTKGDTP